jgi:hypothetical protein
LAEWFPARSDGEEEDFVSEKLSLVRMKGHVNRADKVAEAQTSKTKKFNWRWFIKTAAWCVILVVVGCLAALSPAIDTPLYNWMLFHPWKYPDGYYNRTTAAGIQPEDIYFSAPDGSKLHGWLYKWPDAHRIILFSHGNAGNITLRVGPTAMLLKTGNSVFVYDYEGYGRSEGHPSMSKICDDGLAAYNFVTDSLHYAPNQIVLFGESLGSCVSSDIASHVKCAGVILECPLYSVLRRGNELIPATRMYPGWMWPQNGLDNSHVFAAEHPPLLIVAGTNDTVVPIAHADDLYAIARQSKSYVRIEGARHGDQVMMQSPAYHKQLRIFLNAI